jgi:hypothetical protein
MHYPKHSIFKLALVIAAVLMIAPATMAQDVANGSATATVQAALVVTADQALDFGTVFQGVAKSVASDVTASSGIFKIVGQSSAGIAIYMQLPDYLATATGDDRMVVAFSSTDCNIDSTDNNDPALFVAGSGWINEDPHNVTSAALIGSDLTVQTSIFLGGGVTPTVDQTPGAYTADIILTVAYTGT